MKKWPFEHFYNFPLRRVLVRLPVVFLTLGEPQTFNGGSLMMVLGLDGHLY